MKPSASPHLRVTHGAHSHGAHIPHVHFGPRSVHLLLCVLLLLLSILLLLLALLYGVLNGMRLVTLFHLGPFPLTRLYGTDEAWSLCLGSGVVIGRHIDQRRTSSPRQMLLLSGRERSANSSVAEYLA